jgi:hypothetical protein
MRQVIATLRVSIHTSRQQIMFNHPNHKTDFGEVWYDISKRKLLLSSKLNLGKNVFLLL